MEALATALLILGLGGFTLLVTRPWDRGKYENKIQTVDHAYVPPASVPEPPSWLSFRISGGSVHVKVSRIQNFGYSLTCQSLTINDGSEDPLTIPDPDGVYYEKLCKRFGLTPIPRPEKRWQG